VRLRLELGYDGGGFAGWARQPGLRTVQGVVEGVVERYAPGPAGGLVVAGRTDAGVHASGQVAHLDVEAVAVDCGGLLRRWNGMLPADVRLSAVSAAPEGFDARFSALARTYVYRVDDSPSGPAPLRRYDTVGWKRALDTDALNAASEQLLGEHDFAAYCKRREGATTVRTLLALGWARGADGVLAATVRADAFCHSMVRSLVGALLAVGDGRRPAQWPAVLLHRGERAGEVMVAPPHGLTLVHVEYPQDGELAARAAATRRLRSVPISMGEQ
jgi:tRNA pseudouridine38-40 synthase